MDDIYVKDILTHIFLFLECKRDVVHAMQTCKLWYTAGKHPNVWRDLNFEENKFGRSVHPPLILAVIKKFQSFKSIRSLSFQNNKNLHPPLLKKIIQKVGENLLSLNICGAERISEMNIKHIASVCTKLQHLNARFVFIQETIFIAEIPVLTKLQSLKFSCSSRYRMGNPLNFSPLTSLTNLKSLDISCDTYQGDFPLILGEFINKVPKLKSVSLAGRNLQDNAFASSSLQILDLRRCSFFKYHRFFKMLVRGCPNLRVFYPPDVTIYLVPTHPKLIGGSVISDTFDLLPQYHKLETLRLSDKMRPSNFKFKLLPSMRGKQNGNLVSDTIQLIPTLKNLEVVGYFYFKIGQMPFADVMKSISLTCLITQDDLHKLVNTLVNLESLEVKMNDSFEEVSFQHNKLEHVKLSACFSMTSFTFAGESLKRLFLNLDTKLNTVHITASRLQELHLKKFPIEADLFLEEAMPSLKLFRIQRFASMHPFWQGHIYKLEEYSYYKDKKIQKILFKLAPNAKVNRQPLVVRVQPKELMCTFRSNPPYSDFYLSNPKNKIPFTSTKLLNEITGLNIDVEERLRENVDKANRVKRVYASMQLESAGKELKFYSWEQIAKRRNIPLKE